ncbi:MAG TPA: rhomboid family intramembrane serine protease [Gemmatimonadaceae bacterium]|nr:rhomboid family intramembrane serine protease [Gemmatimonadaceae bacterium]
MIPLKDDLPTLHRPFVTWIMVGLCVSSWFLLQGAGLNAEMLIASVCNLGMVPGELTGAAPLGTGVPIAPGVACVVDNDPINVLTPVTSMFLHGSWGHIISNMLFLWVFGNNVEDSMGHGRFAVFYLACGLAAAAAHVLLDPASPVPTVGASGAISGVMGAYLLLYPRVRVSMLFIFVIIIRVIPVQAWLVLIWWFVLQLLAGIPQLSQVSGSTSGGVAVWAHIGGFVAGVALIKLFARPELVAAHKRAYGARYGH